MRIKLELPDEVEQLLRQRAAAAGMAPEDLVVQMVTKHVEQLIAKEKMTTEIGGDSLPAKKGETT
jgi:uncharacterized protein (DUF1778 family)